MFLYDLHVHTSQSSRCGRSTAEALVEAYVKQGFSGIVVTDHFLNRQSPADPKSSWEEQVADQLRGYRAALRRGDELGLQVFCGWEFTHQDNGEDYATLGLTPQFLYDHPYCNEWDIYRYRDAVHAAGGILIRSHPFREAPYIFHPGVERDDVPDAIEIFNGGNFKKEQNDKAKALADRLGLPGVGSSDAHEDTEAGRCCTGLEEKAADAADLCRRIKEGRVTAICRREYD